MHANFNFFCFFIGIIRFYIRLEFELQLLTMAINIEQPDLERRSVRITRIIEENKVKLEEIEYTLLQVNGLEIYFGPKILL